MTLSLTSREQRQLHDVMSVMLAPLNPWPDGWHAHVLKAVAEFIGAERGGFLRPVQAGGSVALLNHDAPVGRDYIPRFDPLAARYSIWDRLVELGVCNRAILAAPYRDAYYRSSYYRDFIVPARLYEALNLVVCTGGRPSASTVSQIILHSESPTKGRFGVRGLALMRLLVPAFRTGVLTYHKLADRGGRLAATLDRLPTPLAAYDRRGRLLHVNHALASTLAEEGEATSVRQALDALAVRVGRFTATDHALIPARPAAEIATRSGKFRASASLHEQGEFGPDLVVLVALERLIPHRPGSAELRERFGLTAKEAEVALLVAAEGLSNAGLAGRLAISPHTARHHVEQVMLKMQVRGRAGIACQLARFG